MDNLFRFMTGSPERQAESKRIPGHHFESKTKGGELLFKGSEPDTVSDMQTTEGRSRFFEVYGIGPESLGRWQVVSDPTALKSATPLDRQM